MSDKRDEIIRTQLDVIETLLSNSMRRVSDDFWGTSSQAPNNTSTDVPKPSQDKPPVQDKTITSN